MVLEADEKTHQITQQVDDEQAMIITRLQNEVATLSSALETERSTSGKLRELVDRKNKRLAMRGKGRRRSASKPSDKSITISKLQSEVSHLQKKLLETESEVP
jgi:hypothetical protein